MTENTASAIAPSYEEHLNEIVEHWLAQYAGHTALSPGQRAELNRIVRGRSSKDVAVEEGTSPESVRSRRKKVYARLEVSGQIELMALVVKFCVEARS